jgi:hypothetical protein
LWLKTSIEPAARISGLGMLLKNNTFGRIGAFAGRFASGIEADRLRVFQEIFFFV